MAYEKEIERLMGIVREHARGALAKPVTQREYYLATCRQNWKRYAAGVTRRSGEWQRFADALDHATRDMMAAMEKSDAEMNPPRKPRPWPNDDAVEGAMDSVVVHEVAIEPAPPPEPEPSVEDEPVGNTLHAAEAAWIAEQAPAPLAEDPDHHEAREAEHEDRQAARFGFGGLVREDPMAPAPHTEADPELKRKVQDLLRARQIFKKEEEDGD